MIYVCVHAIGKRRMVSFLLWTQKTQVVPNREQEDEDCQFCRQYLHHEMRERATSKCWKKKSLTSFHSKIEIQ
jgi:hypothetical protein